jgi:putative peptidoglycan lipid II flippase
MPHLGIAVATTLGGWLNAGLLFTTLVRRGHFRADARLRRALPLIVLSSAAMGLYLWLASDTFGEIFGATTPSLVRFAALGALVTSGLAVYALAVFATGALDMRQLRGFLGRRSPPGPM